MTRRHDIDALRALAFGLLILYHLGMLYVFDWGWHIKSPYQSEWLQVPMLFLNRWRMHLVFLVSGLSVSFLLRDQTAGRFIASRSWRLLLPLLFGILVVVPLQPYVQGVSNGLVEPGFGRFLIRYFSHSQPWPPGAFDGWQYGFTWNHLWYLAYLWVYTLTLALLLPFLRSRPGQWLRSRLIGLRGWRLLTLPAIPLLIATITLQPIFPDNGDFIHDWYRNAIYFTVFLYGYWIANDGALWMELARLRKWSLAAALTFVPIYLVLVRVLPDEIPDWQQDLIWTLRNLYLWTALCAILGWAHALLNQPFRWLPWANESVYPWYMLHQSLIVGLAYWLIPYRLGPVLEPLLVLAGTVAGCLVISAAIKRVNWLRPLFGLKARTRNHALPAPAAGNRDMLFADTH
jgi:peptidoglycan/LPS O-acetylase OafA/YrhL